jgi:transcriptional regulator
MYIPPSFRADDPDTLAAFMNAHSFATLVTCKEGVPFATHLPMRHSIDSGGAFILVSHMARANPQWHDFANLAEVLTIFTGPHAYISPAWYTVEPAVPTWNYTAVHVYGRPKIVYDHERIVSLLAETVQFYEQAFEHPWSYDLPVDYRDKLIQAIVVFEIEVTRMEGKFKLGQNRSAEDNQSVYATLAGSPDFESRQLAGFMRATYDQTEPPKNRSLAADEMAEEWGQGNES